MKPGPIIHGYASSYRNRGCRCAECREASRLYFKRLREGRQPTGYVSAVGTVRRLRALSTLGWTLIELGRELDVDKTWVSHLRAGKSPAVMTHTHKNVAALYERLSMAPGPSGRARTLAKGKGWHPPLAWDDIDRDPEPPLALSDERWTTAERLDEVKVQRTMVGAYRGELNTEERREIVRRLNSQGMNDIEIARRTGMIERTVLRNRLALGLPPRQRWDAA